MAYNRLVVSLCFQKYIKKRKIFTIIIKKIIFQNEIEEDCVQRALTVSLKNDLSEQEIQHKFQYI